MRGPERSARPRALPCDAGGRARGYGTQPTLPLCHLPLCSEGGGSCLAEQTERWVDGHGRHRLEMRTRFCSRFTGQRAAPGSGVASLPDSVIPAKLAQMFPAGAVMNWSRGQPRGSVCLQEPGCQNTSLLRARVLLAAAGLDGGNGGLRMILRLD